MPPKPLSQHPYSTAILAVRTRMLLPALRKSSFGVIDGVTPSMLTEFRLVRALVVGVSGTSGVSGTKAKSS